MNQDDRASVDRALQAARLSAYPAGEFVGQESFMCASEILSLAARAGVAPGVSVLDLCCGVGGPGLLITQLFGCSYVGVDASPAAIDIARRRAARLSCRFEVSVIPPLPGGRYDVVLLLETMLAFARKEALLRAVSPALAVGGRFAFTMEEGQPLTEVERAVMPGADTVRLLPLAEMLRCLDEAGLRVLWLADVTVAHATTARALWEAYAADSRVIAGQLGAQAVRDLLTAHRLWVDWMRSGRVRKFAVVAEKRWRVY